MSSKESGTCLPRGFPSVTKSSLTSKDTVLEALKKQGGKELALADVYGLGKKMNVDYVVWGSITKIGNSFSVDGKLVDIAAYKSSVWRLYNNPRHG